MAIVYAGAGDSYVLRTSTTDWDGAQGSATTDGTAQHSGRTTYSLGVYARTLGGRGSTTYFCYRSYFGFNLLSESGTIDSATISIYLDNLGDTGNSGKAILVKATALDDGVEDHGNVFSSGTTWHDDISSSVDVSTTEGYHDFDLNSDGIAHLQSAIDSSGTAFVGLVSFYHDYGEHAPASGGDYSRFQVTYTDYTGTSRDPKVDITYAITAATDNATFFGANF